MNCTNHNSELPPLKARCNQMGVHIPARNPTPAEIIPYVEVHLTNHQKHFAKTMDPSCAYYVEWKSVNDDLVNFLELLRATQPAKYPPPPMSPFGPVSPLSSPVPSSSTGKNKNIAAEPGKIAQPAQPQQNSSRNEPGIIPEQPGIKSKLPGTNAEKTGKFPEQLGNSDQPKPNAPPQQPPPPAQEDPDAPPKIQSNDEEFVAAATDLHYQRKGRSPFDKLSPQDQAIVIDLFDKFTWQTVVKTIAQPEPIGFNLKVGKTALYDFHKRYRKRREQQNIQANIELLNKSSNPTQAFAEIFERALQTKAVTIASDPQTSLNVFDALITTVNKHRKQTLAERKQTHAEKSK